VTSKFSRDARLRRRRAEGLSLRQLAYRFAISREQVRRILEQTGGDPLGRPCDDRARRTAELEAERERRRRCIELDRRRLREIDDELEARRLDAILDVAG
jgi:AraC-like DNA-binding protein